MTSHSRDVDWVIWICDDSRKAHPECTLQGITYLGIVCTDKLLAAKVTPKKLYKGLKSCQRKSNPFVTSFTNDPFWIIMLAVFILHNHRVPSSSVTSFKNDQTSKVCNHQKSKKRKKTENNYKSSGNKKKDENKKKNLINVQMVR